MEYLINCGRRDNNVANGAICHTSNVMADINVPSVPMTGRNKRAVVEYIDPLTRQKIATPQFRSLQKFTQTFDASAEHKGILSMIYRSMNCTEPSEVDAAMRATVGAMRSGGHYPLAFWDIVDAWGI